MFLWNCLYSQIALSNELLGHSLSHLTKEKIIVSFEICDQSDEETWPEQPSGYPVTYKPGKNVFKTTRDQFDQSSQRSIQGWIFGEQFSHMMHDLILKDIEILREEISWQQFSLFVFLVFKSQAKTVLADHAD